MSRCGFNTFLPVGLLQISIRILEVMDKISTHPMPSTSRVRPLVPGSREPGLSPAWMYVIAALLVILITGDFNVIQTPFPGHLSKAWPMSLDQPCGTMKQIRASPWAPSQRTGPSALLLLQSWDLTQPRCPVQRCWGSLVIWSHAWAVLLAVPTNDWLLILLCHRCCFRFNKLYETN